MKILVTFFIALLANSASAADFIHPMDFDNSETQKAKAIEYIKENTYQEYCKNINLCQEATLRMMEKKNLDSFKLATKASNREIMDNVIRDYCNNLNMCSYSIIWMMYKKNYEASQQELEW